MFSATDTSGKVSLNKVNQLRLSWGTNSFSMCSCLASEAFFAVTEKVPLIDMQQQTVKCGSFVVFWDWYEVATFKEADKSALTAVGR